MGNHSNRKVITRDDLKTHIVAVTCEFKTLRHRAGVDDNYHLMVTVAWNSGAVFLDDRFGRYSTREELNGEKTSVYLSSLSEGTLDDCLDVARLIDNYLQAIEASEFQMDDDEVDLVNRVIEPLSFTDIDADLDTFDPQVADEKCGKVRQDAIGQMRAVVEHNRRQIS
jgi:uncharacterized protein with HEPN domain